MRFAPNERAADAYEVTIRDKIGRVILGKSKA